MKTWNRIFLSTTIFALLAGCVSPDRLADLQDCGEFSVGLGPGLAADVDLGYLAHPSFGIGAITQRAGWHGRDCGGRWKETEWVFPLVLYIALHPEGDGSAWASYATNRDPTPRGGKEFGELGFWLPPVPATASIRKMCDREPFWTFHNATDFSAGVTLGMVALRAGINPLEIIDLAVGFGGLDIAGDDPRTKANEDGKGKQDMAEK